MNTRTTLTAEDYLARLGLTKGESNTAHLRDDEASHGFASTTGLTFLELVHGKMTGIVPVPVHFPKPPSDLIIENLLGGNDVLRITAPHSPLGLFTKTTAPDAWHRLSDQSIIVSIPDLVDPLGLALTRPGDYLLSRADDGLSVNLVRLHQSYDETLLDECAFECPTLDVSDAVSDYIKRAQAQRYPKILESVVRVGLIHRFAPLPTTSAMQTQLDDFLDGHPSPLRPSQNWMRALTQLQVDAIEALDTLVEEARHPAGG